MSDRNASLRGIYVIVNEGTPDPVVIARAALEGGVRIIQYRAKSKFVPEHARALRDLTAKHDALFIVNDNWKLAVEFGADGVHLGPDDAQSDRLAEIRERLGSLLLGLSCGTEAEARSAQSAGADYIGVGSVYATGSKDDAGEPIGIDGLRRVAMATTLPVAAIGGINANNILPVEQTGVAMAAVISAVSHAGDPQEAARELVRAWEQ